MTKQSPSSAGGGVALSPGEAGDARFLDPALDRLAIRPEEPLGREELAQAEAIIRTIFPGEVTMAHDLLAIEL